ncbi:cation:proton antiporter [Patescibacteria group bacterium]|nr:cation:proton antiporter [Patescibacteria group bacterium]
MANRLKSLRDFFLVLFFINIGMQLQFSAVKEHLRAALLFVAFVFIAKPLLVYLTMKRHGFTNKTSFKT